MALGRTAKFYRDNPEARKKRLAYQKRYNARKSQIERRVANNRENRDKGTYGNGDGLDEAHYSTGGKTRPQAQSINRANNRPKKRNSV